ncbi:hypothetical protein AHiyo6_34440 [Arthrobacter sp. Hiyo6]|nr:hypothetical protein AHiyo6_34440 [Arthrobacter sp. Hiyo6]
MVAQLPSRSTEVLLLKKLIQSMANVRSKPGVESWATMAIMWSSGISKIRSASARDEPRGSFTAVRAYEDAVRGSSPAVVDTSNVSASSHEVLPFAVGRSKPPAAGSTKERAATSNSRYRLASPPSGERATSARR